MAIRDPSDLHEDQKAARAAGMVIAGITLLLAVALFLVVLYSHGYPI
jgi:hypothetical protein